jgi:hypothetical protein
VCNPKKLASFCVAWEEKAEKVKKQHVYAFTVFILNKLEADKYYKSLFGNCS